MSGPLVKYSELEEAFEVASYGGAIESAAYLCKTTGAIYLDYDGINDELPDDLHENDQYLKIPTKLELDLGRPLALRFASRYLPEDYEKVWEFFRKKGAYSKFKILLSQRHALEEWNEFERSAIREELLAWCNENGIEVDA